MLINIGDIKTRLKSASGDLPVYFDFCECVPTNINSWRGNYAEPAIGWSPSGYSGNGKPPTVAQFLDELEMATSGRLYSGWHGDTFSYTDNNQLYVDNYGDSTSTKIMGIEVCESRVILHTAKTNNR